MVKKNIVFTDSKGGQDARFLQICSTNDDTFGPHGAKDAYSFTSPNFFANSNPKRNGSLASIKNSPCPA